MSILFGLLLARRFYCRSALSLSPGRTGGLLPRINAPKKALFITACDEQGFLCSLLIKHNSR